MLHAPEQTAKTQVVQKRNNVTQFRVTMLPQSMYRTVFDIRHTLPNDRGDTAQTMVSAIIVHGIENVCEHAQRSSIENLVFAVGTK